jgi:hypothetical protein
MEGVIATYVPGELIPLVTSTGRTDSDHASFWDQGMPAVVAAQDAEDDFNPYYHTSQDDVDKLDMEYFASLVRAAVGTAAHLAVPSATTDPPPQEPTATLTASPSEIAQGGMATLTWTTTNATDVTLSEADVPLNGSQDVWPSVTTTYVLTATGDGGTATATAVVTVTADPPPEPGFETEPNDSRAEANLVLISGTTITGTVSSATDSDYFGVSLPGGATLVADLIVPSDKNYDIRIYGSVGSTLARGTNPTGEPEHVTYENTSSSSMTVYVRVYGSKRADWSMEEVYQLTLGW